MINFIRGFCMALADSVPGVSGGTIAFLLGFYEKFIHSLDDLMLGDWDKKKSAASFLVRLGVGWIVGFGIAVKLLSIFFESHIYLISSVFIGLIIFAIPVIWKEEKDALLGNYVNLLFTALGTVIVVVIAYLNPVSGSGMTVSVENLSLGLSVYIFFVAMVAISAMVVPGISGSTMLLIFGLYVPIINAIKELMSFHFSYLPVVVIFGLGVLTGIVIVIRLIKSALDNFRSQTIYFIIGLMIGSLYAISMGPTTLEHPLAQMGPESFSVLGFVIGGVIMLLLEKLKVVQED